MILLKVFNKNKGLNFFIINLLCVFIFSIIYYIEDKLLSNQNSFIDYLYFSLITQTTVGYHNELVKENKIIKFTSIFQLFTILFIFSIH